MQCLELDFKGVYVIEYNVIFSSHHHSGSVIENLRLVGLLAVSLVDVSGDQFFELLEVIDR